MAQSHPPSLAHGWNHRTSGGQSTGAPSALNQRLNHAYGASLAGPFAAPQQQTNPNVPIKRKPVGGPASPPTASTTFHGPRAHAATASQSSLFGARFHRKSPPAPVAAGSSQHAVGALQPHEYATPLIRARLSLTVNSLHPPNILSPEIPQSPGLTPFHELPEDQARAVLSNLDHPSSPPRPHERSYHLQQRSMTSPMTSPPRQQRAGNASGRAAGPGPIQIHPANDFTNTGLATPGGSSVSKFGAFFGWKGKVPPSPMTESAPTTISDRSSPVQSPNGTSLTSYPPSGKLLLSASDASRSNMPSAALFPNGGFPQGPPTPAINQQIEDMEEELRDISTELASAIRREMELEEQVERLVAEGPHALEKEKRTSDYFSDSGASSQHNPDVTIGQVDDVERLKRRSEQEKAQMKLDLSQKLQEERGLRRKLEEHVRSLEDHLQNAELGRGGGMKLVDLERRLSDEKRAKENAQEMLKALHTDLENHRNERDNLRDEVVPNLRLRVDGLEAEATDYQKLQYENSRMQQELQALKAGRVAPIAEQEGGVTTRRLSRNGSVLKRGHGRSNSFSRNTESREQLFERVKDTEDQRDALHVALRSLLERQRLQTKQHEKALRSLATERDGARELHSPRRKGFEQEVVDLREEIDCMRRRADDALAQKWQCEKGLIGLRTDLDRSRMETESLRQLLQGQDVIVPKGLEGLQTQPATSESLEQAYKDLASARKRAESLRNTSTFSVADQENLTRQLAAAGSRVEVLSAQVQRQLNQNTDLRERLAQAVSKGETAQSASEGRIGELQTKLRDLEEQLAAAQQQSEAGVAAHEDDVRDLRQQQDRRLLRLKTSNSNLSSPRHSHLLGGPTSPFSPTTPRLPRLDRTSTGPGVALAEAHRAEHLEGRVRELEQALRDAEGEMSEVVQRMNYAQIEAMELQTARDDAQKMTRALQSQLEAENASMGHLTRSLAH